MSFGTSARNLIRRSIRIGRRDARRRARPRDAAGSPACAHSFGMVWLATMKLEYGFGRDSVSSTIQQRTRGLTEAGSCDAGRWQMAVEAEKTTSDLMKAPGPTTGNGGGSGRPEQPGTPLSRRDRAVRATAANGFRLREPRLTAFACENRG